MRLFITLLALSFLSPTAVRAATVFKPMVSASSTTTSTQILPVNTSRKYLLITNNGTDTVYVKVDTIHSGTEGIALPAGGNYEPLEVPVNSIWAKAASGTQALTIVEGN